MTWLGSASRTAHYGRVEREGYRALPEHGVRRCARRAALALRRAGKPFFPGVLIVTVGLLALASASASAFNAHVFSSTIASSGSGAGQVSSPSALAVDLTTHDVYVADPGNLRVDQFSSSGSFIRAWGWGVADGLPALETCTLSCQAGLPGSGAGQFTTPTFVAVDNSGGASAGDVYVGDTGDALVSKFTSEGALVSSWGAGGQLDGSTATDGPFGSIAGIAVNAGGTLMVLNESSRLFEFAQDGTFTTDFGVERGTSANGLAVDSAGNFFKVNGDGSVEAFTSSASDVGQVTESQSAAGLATDASSGDLYLSAGAEAEHYSFTGTGTVSESGGGTCTFAPVTPCPPTDAFGSGTLSRGTGIAVDPASANVYVADALANQIDVFVPAEVPEVKTEAASAVAPTSATLHGTVNPEGIALSSCQFEYRPQGSTGPGRTVPCEPTPAGATAVAVSADISGLERATQYNFRLEVSTASGTTRGSVKSFNTPSPPRVSEESATEITHVAATLNATIDPRGNDTTYQFEYGTSDAYGTSVPVPEADIGIAESGVSQPIGGLQVGVTYHYRVAATNSAGTVYGHDRTFATLPPALIEDSSIDSVGPTSATMLADINPLGSDTSYHFEYGTSSAYGTTVPVPDGDTGAGEAAVRVSQLAGGLQENTQYHFRLVAKNALGSYAGPDQIFTTTSTAACPNVASRQGPGVLLPDCRGYEQVTPVNKGDSLDLELRASQNQGFAAENGDHFMLTTQASFAQGEAYLSSYVFSRGSAGWTTTSLSPGPGVHEVKALAFNPVDLSQVAVTYRQIDHVPGQLEETFATSVAGPPGGPFTEIASVPNTSSGNVQVGPLRAKVVGASADVSHVVIESTDHELAPGAAGQDEESNALYEWVAGQLSLVNVATDGTLLNPCGAVLGLGQIYPGASHNAVSSDGSKILFTSPDPHGHGAGCPSSVEVTPRENPPQLYMRVDGTRTVQISAPNRGVTDAGGAQEAIYVGASADDSKVFFLSRAKLTADDTTHATELYEYNTDAPEGERLVRISSGESGAAEGKVDFVGAISSDGSAVYFGAFGKLATGGSVRTPGEPEVAGAREGMVNLYRYDTATKQTRFVATIGEFGYPLGAISVNSEIWYLTAAEEVAQSAGLEAEANWYTTADGRYLVFGSYLPLTGYRNAAAPDGRCVDLAGRGNGGFTSKCAELFRYDSVTDKIVCVSCGPAGVAQVGEALFAREPFVGPAAAPPRPISEDGTRVFFDTTNALVPQTTAGKLHVYEWHGGTVSLISSPGDQSNSFFLGSSASGSDVFFGTHAQLAPQDTDLSGDLYDARVNGGFVGVVPPTCTGSGCQGVPAPPPGFATPSSTTFEGTGNFAPASQPSSGSKPKALTRTQKLAQALRACRRRHNPRRRARCRARAKALYGPAHRSSKPKRRTK
jgi:hypothetical protein